MRKRRKEQRGVGENDRLRTRCRPAPSREASLYSGCVPKHLMDMPCACRKCVLVRPAGADAAEPLDPEPGLRAAPVAKERKGVVVAPLKLQLLPKDGGHHLAHLLDDCCGDGLRDCLIKAPLHLPRQPLLRLVIRQV